MSDLVVSDFIVPHYIEELGKDGLWSDEIAQGLGVRHEDLKRNISNGKVLEILAKTTKTTFTQLCVKVSTGGRPIERWAVETKLAKIITARYQNERGITYLSFLIDCETIVTKHVPELLLENKRLKEANAVLTCKLNHANALNSNHDATKKSKKLRKKANKEDPIVNVLQETLFETGGTGLKLVQRRTSQVTKVESILGEFIHLTKVTDGVSKARDEKQKELVYPQKISANLFLKPATIEGKK